MANIEFLGNDFAVDPSVFNATTRHLRREVIREFVKFLEDKLIPVHTTMTVEPGYRIELITKGTS